MMVEKVLIAAELNPDKEAICYGSRRITFGQLRNQIFKTAEKLNQIPNSTFLFQAGDYHDIIGILACNLIGKSGMVLPSDLKSAQIEELEHVEGAVLFAGFGSEEVEAVAEPKKSSSSFRLGLLSSGSSGKSKVIWKTNDNWEKAFGYQSEIFSNNSEDRVLIVNALGYSANLNSALHALWQGSTVILTELSEAASWPYLVEKAEVSSVFMVPSHARLFVKNGLKMDQITSFVTAGEKLDATTARRILRLLPNVTLSEYYGASELGHISYHQNEEILENSASVGRAFPEVDIEIEGHQLKVHSPYISPDYESNPTVNDLGYFEGEKLILLGREGRMFNRRGLNIFAQEIENTALCLTIVKEAALVKREHSEKLVLFIVTLDAEKDAVQKVRLFLNEKLPKSKQPNFIIELEELPHSEAGKIDFRALSKMNEEMSMA
ncbi:AMP-binding protein [Jiulongibacter sp. NS-SX5]|uniref:AMP-binding protein n=1 Tax=Jiulongibacter sp. NS-SX5 TaxID=3463854 RepID=UPI004058B1FD